MTPAALDTSRDLPARGPDRPVIIVRRDMLDRFTALQRDLAGEDVEVRWDRRVGDRRQQAGPPPAQVDRRGTERRRPPPSSWDVLDFVIAWPVE